MRTALMAALTLYMYVQNQCLNNYIGGSLYVGLRLIFQDGDQIYNFQMIITLLSYILET